MVRHQAPGPQFQAVPPGVVSQQISVEQAVLIRIENNLTAISPLG
jgi:hypothetical protein